MLVAAGACAVCRNLYGFYVRLIKPNAAASNEYGGLVRWCTQHFSNYVFLNLDIKISDKFPTGGSMANKEIVVYQADGILITSARAEFGTRMYSMANVTSVSFTKIKSNQTFPMLFIIVGAVLIMMFGFVWILSASTGGSSQSSLFVCGVVGGVAGIGIGAWMWQQNKPKYAVRIESSDGTANALVSQHREEILTIVKAMKQAIVERG
jgi:hypothetical protein